VDGESQDRFLFESTDEFANVILGFRKAEYEHFMEENYTKAKEFKEMVDFANVFNTQHKANAHVPIYAGDEILSTFKNGGIGVNIWLTGSLSANQDALVRVMPGSNPYRLNTAAYMGRNPEYVVMNPAFLIWGASSYAFPGRRMYKMMQQTFTQVSQLGYQDLTLFYGKGIVNPASGDTLLMTPVEDSGAFMIQKNMEPEATATCEGYFVWEWSRPSLHSESVFGTESRYTFNVAQLILPTAMFETFTNKFVGTDFKLNILQNAFHYLSSMLAVVILVALPFLQPFSGFAYLKPVIAFLSLTVIMMNSVSLFNFLRHMFITGNFWKAIGRFAKDTVQAFPYTVSMIIGFAEASVKVANEMFSFVPTLKQPVFGVQDRRTRFQSNRLFKFRAQLDGTVKNRFFRIGIILAGLGLVGGLLVGTGFVAAGLGWIVKYALIGSAISFVIAGIIHHMNNATTKGIPVSGIVAIVAIAGFIFSTMFSTLIGMLFVVPYLLAVIAFLTGTDVFDTYVETDKNDSSKQTLSGWRLSEMFGQRQAVKIWFRTLALLMLSIIFAPITFIPVGIIAIINAVLTVVLVVKFKVAFENILRVLGWNVMHIFNAFSEGKNDYKKVQAIVKEVIENISKDALIGEVENNVIKVTLLASEVPEGLQDAVRAKILKAIQEGALLVKAINAEGIVVGVVPASEINIEFASINLIVPAKYSKIRVSLKNQKVSNKARVNQPENNNSTTLHSHAWPIMLAMFAQVSGSGWVSTVVAAAAAGILMLALIRKYIARKKHSQPSSSQLSTLSVAGVARNNKDVKVVDAGNTSSRIVEIDYARRARAVARKTRAFGASSYNGVTIIEVFPSKAKTIEDINVALDTAIELLEDDKSREAIAVLENARRDALTVENAGAELSEINKMLSRQYKEKIQALRNKLTDIADARQRKAFEAILSDTQTKRQVVQAANMKDIGDVLVGNNDFEEAICCYEEALAVLPQAVFPAVNANDVIEILTALTEAYRNYERLAEVKKNNGEVARAVEMLEHLASSERTHMSAMDRLMVFASLMDSYYEAGRKEDVIITAETVENFFQANTNVLEQDVPSINYMKAAIAYVVAAASYDTGDQAKALSLLNESAELFANAYKEGNDALDWEANIRATIKRLNSKDEGNDSDNRGKAGNNSSGYTLVEVPVVITVVGLAVMTASFLAQNISDLTPAVASLIAGGLGILSIAAFRRFLAQRNNSQPSVTQLSTLSVVGVVRNIKNVAAVVSTSKVFGLSNRNSADSRRTSARRAFTIIEAPLAVAGITLAAITFSELSVFTVIVIGLSAAAILIAISLRKTILAKSNVKVVVSSKAKRVTGIITAVVIFSALAFAGFDFSSKKVTPSAFFGNAQTAARQAYNQYESVEVGENMTFARYKMLHGELVHVLNFDTAKYDMVLDTVVRPDSIAAINANYFFKKNGNKTPAALAVINGNEVKAYNADGETQGKQKANGSAGALFVQYKGSNPQIMSASKAQGYEIKRATETGKVDSAFQAGPIVLENGTYGRHVLTSSRAGTKSVLAKHSNGTWSLIFTDDVFVGQYGNPLSDMAKFLSAQGYEDAMLVDAGARGRFVVKGIYDEARAESPVTLINIIPKATTVINTGVKISTPATVTPFIIAAILATIIVVLLNKLFIDPSKEVKTTRRPLTDRRREAFTLVEVPLTLAGITAVAVAGVSVQTLMMITAMLVAAATTVMMMRKEELVPALVLNAVAAGSAAVKTSNRQPRRTEKNESNTVIVVGITRDGVTVKLIKSKEQKWDNEYFDIYVGNQYAGFTDFKETDDAVELSDIEVEKYFRERGVARAVNNWFAQKAKMTGKKLIVRSIKNPLAARLVLATMEDDNELSLNGKQVSKVEIDILTDATIIDTLNNENTVSIEYDELVEMDDEDDEGRALVRLEDGNYAVIINGVVRVVDANGEVQDDVEIEYDVYKPLRKIEGNPRPTNNRASNNNYANSGSASIEVLVSLAGIGSVIISAVSGLGWVVTSIAAAVAIAAIVMIIQMINGEKGFLANSKTDANVRPYMMMKKSELEALFAANNNVAGQYVGSFRRNEGSMISSSVQRQDAERLLERAAVVHTAQINVVETAENILKDVNSSKAYLQEASFEAAVNWMFNRIVIKEKLDVAKFGYCDFVSAVVVKALEALGYNKVSVRRVLLQIKKDGAEKYTPHLFVVVEDFNDPVYIDLTITQYLNKDSDINGILSTGSALSNSSFTDVKNAWYLDEEMSQEGMENVTYANDPALHGQRDEFSAPEASASREVKAAPAANNGTTYLSKKQVDQIVKIAAAAIRELFKNISNAVASSEDARDEAFIKAIRRNPFLVEIAEAFANDRTILSDGELIRKGSDDVSTKNEQIRIELRNLQADGSASQVAVRGFFLSRGTIRERLEAQLAGYSVDVLEAGKATLEFNRKGVNKSLAIAYLERRLSDLLDLMGYRAGEYIDVRKTRTIFAADVDGTVLSSPRPDVKGIQGIHNSPTRDGIEELIDMGGVYAAISGNNMSRLVGRLIERNAFVRQGLIIVGNGAADMKVFTKYGKLISVDDYNQNALTVVREEQPVALDMVYAGDNVGENGNDYPGYQQAGFNRSLIVANKTAADMRSELHPVLIAGNEQGMTFAIQEIIRIAKANKGQVLFTDENIQTIVRNARGLLSEFKDIEKARQLVTTSGLKMFRGVTLWSLRKNLYRDDNGQIALGWADGLNNVPWSFSPVVAKEFAMDTHTLEATGSVPVIIEADYDLVQKVRGRLPQPPMSDSHENEWHDLKGGFPIDTITKLSIYSNKTKAWRSTTNKNVIRNIILRRSSKENIAQANSKEDIAALIKWFREGVSSSSNTQYVEDNIRYKELRAQLEKDANNEEIASEMDAIQARIVAAHPKVILETEKMILIVEALGRIARRSTVLQLRRITEFFTEIIADNQTQVSGYYWVRMQAIYVLADRIMPIMNPAFRATIVFFLEKLLDAKDQRADATANTILMTGALAANPIPNLRLAIGTVVYEQDRVVFAEQIQVSENAQEIVAAYESSIVVRKQAALDAIIIMAAKPDARQQMIAIETLGLIGYSAVKAIYALENLLVAETNEDIKKAIIAAVRGIAAAVYETKIAYTSMNNVVVTFNDYYKQANDVEGVLNLTSYLKIILSNLETLKNNKGTVEDIYSNGKPYWAVILAGGGSSKALLTVLQELWRQLKDLGKVSGDMPRVMTLHNQEDAGGSTILIKGGFLQEWGLRVTADGDPTKAVSGIIPRWMDKIESMRIKDRATAEYYGNSVVAVLTEAFARVTFLESEKTLFEEYRRSRLAAAAVIDAQFVTNGKIDLVGQSMKNLMMKGMILQYKGYEDQTINPYGIIAAYKKYFETMGINVSPTPTHYEGLALKTVRQEENSLYSVTIYDQDQISHSPAFGQLPITHVEFYGARVDADVPGVQEAIEGAQIKLTGISSFVTSSAPLLMDKRIGTVLKDSTMILNANYESENIGLTIHQMTQMISRWVGQRFDAAVKVLLLNNYKQSKETLGDRIDIFKSKQLQYYGPVRWLSEKEIEAVKAENPGLTIVDEHSLVDVQEVDSRREGEAKQYILSLVDSKVARLIREANGDENLIPAAVNKQSKQISRKRGQEGFTAIEVPVAIAGIGIVVISAMNGLGWVVATIAAAAAGILMFSLLRKHFARSKHSQPSHSKLSTLSVAGVARNNNDVKVVNVGTTSSKRRKALSLALAAIELFEFIITAGFGLNNKIADNTECIDGAKESRDQKERLIQADAVSSDNGQYVTAAGTFVVADVERSSNETETVEIAASGVYSNGNDVGSWNMVPQVYDMPMAAPYTPISYADNEEVLDGATTIDLRVGNVFDLDPAQNILDDQQLQALKDLFEAVTYLSNAPPVYVTDNLSNTKGAITAFETAQIVLFNNDEDKIFIHTSVLDRIAALSSTEKETYLEFLKGVFEGHERFHAEGINDEATALLKTIEYLSENLKTLKATISVLNNPEIYGVRTEAIFKADLNDISSDGKEAIYRGNASYEHRIAKGTIVVEGDVVISDQDRYLEETDDLEGLIRKEKAKFLLVYRREVALFDKIQESLKDNPEAQGFAIGQGLYSSLEKKSKELIGEKDEQGRILSAIGAVEIGISKIFKMGEDMMKTSPNIGMTIVEFAKDLPVILSGLKNSEYLNQENGVENKDVILVMHEMTPLRIIKIAYQYNVVAIVSELGTQNAHASILARSLGLVTLTGMYLDGNIAKGSAYKNLLGGEYGIIDAHAGELIINPNEEMYAKYSDSENILKGLLQKAHRKVTSTCKTKDGAKIPISVNLDNIADSNKIVELIGKADLEGVGLLRFEFLILKIGYGDWKLVDLFAGSILGIIKQLQETAEVYGKRLKLTIRMPDKDKANIKLPNVDPTSTLEGSQWYLLSDIGRECLKVALRSTASAEKQYLETTEKPMVEVQVIFPMLNTESEAKGIKEIVDEVRAEFKEEVLANLGIMVETPQAVDELAEMIKVFGKLAVINFGSNDAEACITHTDREMGIEVGRNILNKQVIVWIAQTCAIAKIYNIPVCVCGELANFDEFALIGISLRKKGYDITGSVNPRQVAWLKYFTGFTKAAEAADLGKSINWQKESSKQISRKYSEAVLKIIESIDAADSERSENESSDPSKTLGPKGNNAGFAAVEVLAVVGATGTVVMSGWVVASVLAGVGAVITSILLIRRLLKNKLFKATIVVALFFMAVIAFAPSSAGGSTNTLTTNASEVQRQNQNIDIHPVYAIHISKECFELVSEHLDNLFGEAKDNGQKLKIYIENNLLMPGYAVESFNAYFPGMNPKQLVDSKEYQFAFEPFLTAQHSKSQENMDMILQAFVSGNVDGLDFELNGYYRAMMTYLARKKNEGYSFDVVSEKPSLEYMVSELDRVIYGHVDYDWKAINQLRGRKLAKDVIEDLAMDANTRVIILMGYMHQPMTEVLKTTGYPVNPYIEDKVVEYAVAQEKVLTVSQDSDEFYKISQAYKSIARELNVHLDAIDREIVVFEIKHSIRSAVKSAADHWVGFILAMLAFAGSLLVVKRTFTMRKKYSGKGNKQDPGSDLEAYPVAVPMKVVLGSGRQRTVAKAVLVNGLRGQEYRIQYVSGDSFVVGQESTLQHRINTVLDDVKERGVPSLPSQFGIVITDSVKATEKHIMTYNRTQNILFIHTWYFNVVNKKKAVHLVSDIDRHEILGHILLGLDEEEARKLSFEYFGERLSMLKYFLEYMEDLKDYGVELDDDYAVKLEEIAKAGHAWMLVGRDLSDRLQQEIDS
ncbi:MAG: YvcK family protein, partial [Candidatus Omnitrophica bacterium]|nr:YvcK family protein [Candidatus Omnitrophota bacterium]